jgi:hypothetical protein
MVVFRQLNLVLYLTIFFIAIGWYGVATLFYLSCANCSGDWSVDDFER